MHMVLQYTYPSIIEWWFKPVYVMPLAGEDGHIEIHTGGMDIPWGFWQETSESMPIGLSEFLGHCPLLWNLMSHFSESMRMSQGARIVLVRILRVISPTWGHHVDCYITITPIPTQWKAHNHLIILYILLIHFASYINTDLVYAYVCT